MAKKILTVLSFGTCIAVAVAANLHPLNVKTGLWQIAETFSWTGLPPELGSAMANGKTRSYQSCVTAEDLNTNPWAHGSRESCTWNVLSSTGTDMDIRGTSCDLGTEYGMTAEAHGKIHVLDSENGTGSFDVVITGNGQTINGHASYVGKWVGSSCPKE
jgi:Protein of unknown function (DUF3617)